MSDRNGVPVSASRRVAGLEGLAARLAPGLASHRRGGSRRGSPGSCAARSGCGAACGRTPTPAYVTATPVVLRARPRPGAVLRVELDAHPRGRVRPLLLEVLGGRDDGDLLHDVVVQQLGGERAARTWSCRRRGWRRRGSRAAAAAGTAPAPRLPGAQLARRCPRGRGRGRRVAGGRRRRYSSVQRA